VIIISEELIETGKKNAAYKAVDENIEDGIVLGIGSGSTIVYAIERITQLNDQKALNLKCIPTSFQAFQLIIENHLTLGSLDQYPEIDLVIDGADEIDYHLNLIKGGGGCHVREKIIASVAKKFVIIADFRKNSKRLGENWKKGVPIEVIPMSYIPVMKKIKQLGGTPILRMAKSKMGPIVSDNGNFILDADFGIIDNPAELNNNLLNIPGIVDTGLFIGMANKAYIGQKDGSVLTLQK
jgi:ribose 5-phosphate isomerase A